ncbi:hypothetical protein [Xanthomonas nasturtii]|uniref:hypothetical protein n=1 Tax=Xanthomonas nasturtii TaxID=1843581 RepID=UPI0012904CD0|nr:hypothetical protein [Xanthomonas nasturtii]WVL55977.1 hypothetical protein M3O54_016640 [Xanthomonas nasturtii]
MNSFGGVAPIAGTWLMCNNQGANTLLDLTDNDIELISAGVGWKDVLAIGDAVIDFGQVFAKGWNESKAHPLT